MIAQLKLLLSLLWVLVPSTLGRSSAAATASPHTAFYYLGRRMGTTTKRTQRPHVKIPPLVLLRGGAESSTTTPTATAPQQDRELTLEEKVHAAMIKLGLKPPPLEGSDDDTEHDAASIHSTGNDDPDLVVDEADNETTSCADGICAMPGALATDTTDTPARVLVDDNNNAVESQTPSTSKQEDPESIADRIAQTMNVDKSMVWAALGATSTAAVVHVTTSTTTSHEPSAGQQQQQPQRIYNEQAARNMISLELEMIAQIRDDSEEVLQLVDEGWNRFLARRALAFAERNVADARAILMADQDDEEAEREEQEQAARQQQREEDAASFQTVQVDANFDPTQISATTSPSDSASGANAPLAKPPAPKESVVFEATTAQLQQLVLESPVPVLLDIYADWCGPCKALSPILEEIAIKSGGALRLVKVNSDHERVVATTLQVTALPTIFGIRDGRIVHMFQGMPKSETMLRNFLMGLLIPDTVFDPPVTAAQDAQYTEWSNQLAKVAGSAAFPFAARERLQDRVGRQLDELVVQCGGMDGIDKAERAVKTVRALLSNVVRDPNNAKFRSVQLDNKVVATKVALYPAAVGLLKVCGFQHRSENDKTVLTVGGKGQKMINVAPLSVARDALDKWIERTRYEVAKAARHRRDEEDRVQVAQDLAVQAEAQERARREQEEAADAAKAAVDPDLCQLKLRLDGKQKIHEVSVHPDRALSTILEMIPGLSLPTEEEELQITCVAKRLTVSSTDAAAMQKSLRDHGLLPAATLVVKIKTPSSNDSSGTTTLISQRAAAMKKKKGSHTMQSVGIYGKDDNLKGELIDGGGGTLYEHDVTDDEADEEQEAVAATGDADDGDPAAKADETEQCTAASDAEGDESIQDVDEE